MKNSIKCTLAILFSVLVSCSKDSSNAEQITTNPISIFADQVQVAVQKNVNLTLNGDLPFDVANINWDFGDGVIFYGTSSNGSVYHQYQNTGSYAVKANIFKQNGEIIEVLKTITVINTNMVKVTKITIQNYPNKNCERFVASGISGYWVTFFGRWDESEGFGSTSEVDGFADTYLTLSKFQDKPDSSNPSNLVSNIKTVF